MTHPLTVWCQTFAIVFLTTGFLEYNLFWAMAGVFMLAMASVFAAVE